MKLQTWAWQFITGRFNFKIPKFYLGQSPDRVTNKKSTRLRVEHFCESIGNFSIKFSFITFWLIYVICPGYNLVTEARIQDNRLTRCLKKLENIAIRSALSNLRSTRDRGAGGAKGALAPRPQYFTD